MKVLILKPSSLGDVIQALPVLRLIKSAHPAAEIYWWVDSSLAALLEGDPDLTGVVLFERRRWASPRHWGEIWHSVRWMRQQSFDWVIDLQCLARSGAFAWLAAGKVLIGLDEVREGARGFYDLAVTRPSPQTHAVDWYLKVLPQLGVPVHGGFDWIPKREQVSLRLREKWRTDLGRCIVFQPGARWENKRWPVGHFAELARLIGRELPGFYIAVLGGRDDESLGDEITRALPERCLNLAGKLTLPEMVEWIRQSDLMVSNDTGPMHAGAALGKPVVAIFGPTDPRRTGPYGQINEVLRHPLACAPCFKKKCAYFKPLECLRAIPPAMVLAEIRRRLGNPL